MITESWVVREGWEVLGGGGRAGWIWSKYTVRISQRINTDERKRKQ